MDRRPVPFVRAQSPARRVTMPVPASRRRPVVAVDRRMPSAPPTRGALVDVYA